MKLELKHLAPYLPYGLKAYHMFDGKNLERDVTPHNVFTFVNGDTNAKIALRPLSHWRSYPPYLNEYSDLENGDFYRGEDIIIDSNGKWSLNLKDSISWEPLWMQEFLNKMYKHHFDLFGLIDAGLAIDINTL